jgi:hypothetical protein
MTRTRTLQTLAAAILAGVALSTASAVASVPPPDSPISPHFRLGDEYRTASSSCSVTATNTHSLAFACAAGQTGTVSYRLRVDHSAPLRIRTTGDGLTSLSTRKRDGRWLVTFHVGEGTTTIAALDAYRAS